VSLPSPSPVSAIASQPSDRDPLISTVQTLADPARAPLLLPTPPSPTVPPPCASLPPPQFAARPSPCFAVAVTSLAPAPRAGSLAAAAQPSPSRLSPPSRAHRCGRGDSPSATSPPRHPCSTRITLSRLPIRPRRPAAATGTGPSVRHNCHLLVRLILKSNPSDFEPLRHR